MCLRLHKRKKKLDEILWESLPGAVVDCSASPGVVTNVSDCGWLLESR